MKFAGQVVNAWVGNHPYKLVLNNFPLIKDIIKAPFVGTQKDINEGKKAILQHAINMTLCCPPSKLKPTEGVAPDEAIANKLWNEKYAFTEEDKCDYVGEPGYGCSFKQKPTCKELYEALIKQDFQETLFVDMNKKGSIQKNKDNYLIKLMKNNLEEFGFTDKDEVNNNTGANALRTFFIKNFNEESVCKNFEEERIDLKPYQEELDIVIKNAFDVVDPNSVIETSTTFVNYGPVKVIYDDVKGSIDSGELDCDDWKNSRYVGHSPQNSEAEKQMIIDSLDSFKDGIDGFSTRYCQYMNAKDKALEISDCKKAVEGACKGTDFETLFPTPDENNSSIE